jgi:hypothetical protein
MNALTEVLAQFDRTPNPDLVLEIKFERHKSCRALLAAGTPVALANRPGVRLGLPPHSSAELAIFDTSRQTEAPDATIRTFSADVGVQTDQTKADRILTLTLARIVKWHQLSLILAPYKQQRERSRSVGTSGALIRKSVESFLAKSWQLSATIIGMLLFLCHRAWQ